MHDSSVIKILNQIFDDAIYQKASDVHFEPYANNCRIRFRIDGILYEKTTIEISLAQRLGSRLKVMAHLDIAERRLPQDGRFTLEYKNIGPTYTSNTHTTINKRDCRISTCPTMFGEKIVIRILNSTHANLNIAQLGMNTKQQKIFLQHIRATQGMILVTGPTGSGKTVTLYTALNLLNTIDHNILTVEDPIEIDLPGINQVEVNHKIGLSFALALRTFLRQDPDIIMVGEIRDLETAQIAIKAAQTGHLVLATLHTNSAAASIIRLINMEVATYNLANSLNLLIAQRLIRTLCPHCKQTTKLPENILKQQKINSSYNKLIFQANHAGCNKCKNGYAGRIGIFELLPISPQISSMILNKQSQTEIEQQAMQEGMLNLRTKAWYKVLNGITSISEINRVIL